MKKKIKYKDLGWEISKIIWENYYKTITQQDKIKKNDTSKIKMEYTLI